MGRRRVGDLDRLLELYARWLENGEIGLAVGSASSLLARWMDAKGHMVFGGSGPCEAMPRDSVESRIHLAIYYLARESPLCADVLRLEIDAGWREVAQRYRAPTYRPRTSGQLEKALTLGVSLRTYKRRLAEARDFVATRLGINELTQ